jgi:hypothetical protein
MAGAMFGNSYFSNGLGSTGGNNASSRCVKEYSAERTS